MLLFITTLSSIISMFILYLYVKNAGSKLDYFKASSFLQNGRFEDAEIYYKIALKKTNKTDLIHLSSLMGLHDLYLKTDRKDESLILLNEAIELSNKNDKWKIINIQLNNLKKKHFS